jgi:hypothetical protein
MYFLAEDAARGQIQKKKGRKRVAGDLCFVFLCLYFDRLYSRYSTHLVSYIQYLAAHSFSLFHHSLSYCS